MRRAGWLSLVAAAKLVMFSREEVEVLESRGCRGGPWVLPKRWDPKGRQSAARLPCGCGFVSYPNERGLPARSGRSCEQSPKSRGRFSLVPWPSDSEEKICQSNVAIADAMGEAFVASDRAFMPFRRPKVPQLLPVTFLCPKPR